MKKLLIIIGCLLWQFVNAQVYEKGVSEQLATQRSQNISDINYDLTFNIPADQNTPVSGKAIIYFILQEQAEVVLDFQGELTEAIHLNGKNRKIHVQNEHIVLPMKQMRAGFNKVELHFVSKSTALSRHPNYLYTMFVPDRAHSCFPCFDQPDLRARYTTHLNVPEGWKTMVSDGRNPIPTYLYSFIAGRFQEKTNQDTVRPMRALYLETEPSKVSQLNQIFDEASQALRWMEDYTGLKYPFSEYGMAILPGYQLGGMDYPGVIQLSDRRVFLDQNPSEDDRLRHMEFIAHEAAHQWFGSIVSPKKPEDVWAKEVLANFMASKFTRRKLSRVNLDQNYMRTYQARAIAIDRTEGTHPIFQSLRNQDEAAMLCDNIIYDKVPVAMRIIEHITGHHNMQNCIQKYLRDHYFNSASWDDFIEALDQEAPEVGVRQLSEVWIRQKGMPQIHTSYQNGKLVVRQTDPYGRGLCWRQKFDIRIIYEMGGSKTINIDMRQPTMTFDLPQAPNYIIPNFNGNGYGRFTVDKEYTKKLPLRLIVTRDDLQRYSLLQTLFDNYLMGNIPPSYFGELYRNMTKERNPLIMQTCIDHMFKIAFDHPKTERHTLEQCIMDILPENRHSECRRTIIRKMARNASSPEVLEQLYRIWKSHNDPLFDAHDYMQMAYRLAIMRPNEWQRILNTERQRLSTDLLRQEFDYVSRACNPGADKQQQLFNELLKPENRQHESWTLQALRLLNADVREPQSNQYITASLNALEQLQQSNDVLFACDWLYALLESHKSTDARQKVEQFLRQHPNLRPQLRNKILEAAWPLMNKSK